MNDSRPSFRVGVVRPVECIQDGWQLIRNNYWLNLGIVLVGVLIAGAVPVVLVGPMMCGIYLCLLRQSRGQRLSFEMLFKGFDHFVQSLIAALIMMIPMIVLMVPAYILFFAAMIGMMPKPGQGGQPNPNFLVTFFVGMGIIMLVIFAVSIVIQVLFFFTYPLIVDKKLGGLQAIGVSLRAARANFSGVLGLVVLTMLLSMLGALACYVGMFFVMPIHFAAVTVAYKRVFPDEEEPEPPAEDGVGLEPISH